MNDRQLYLKGNVPDTGKKNTHGALKHILAKRVGIPPLGENGGNI